MPRKTSSYYKGYALEREIKEKLSKAGFTVFRCCGSRPVDLILVKEGKVVLCEIKKGASTNTPVETLAISESTKLPAIYIVRKKRRTYWRIIGELPEQIKERLVMLFGEPLNL